MLPPTSSPDPARVTTVLGTGPPPAPPHNRVLHPHCLLVPPARRCCHFCHFQENSLWLHTLPQLLGCFSLSQNSQRLVQTALCPASPKPTQPGVLPRDSQGTLAPMPEWSRRSAPVCPFCLLSVSRMHWAPDSGTLSPSPCVSGPSLPSSLPSP